MASCGKANKQRRTQTYTLLVEHLEIRQFHSFSCHLIPRFCTRSFSLKHPFLLFLQLSYSSTLSSAVTSAPASGLRVPPMTPLSHGVPSTQITTIWTSVFLDGLWALADRSCFISHYLAPSYIVILTKCLLKDCLEVASIKYWRKKYFLTTWHWVIAYEREKF